MLLIVDFAVQLLQRCIGLHVLGVSVFDALVDGIAPLGLELFLLEMSVAQRNPRSTPRPNQAKRQSEKPDKLKLKPVAKKRPNPVPSKCPLPARLTTSQVSRRR